MTQDNPRAAEIVVEQRHRDAAANYVKSDNRWAESSPSVLAIRKGKAGVDLAEAFARFEASLVRSTDTPSGEDAAPHSKRAEANSGCWAKALDDEPMFIILGRDPDGANIVRLWAQRRSAAGDPSHGDPVMALADAMDAWRAAGHLPSSAPAPEAYPPIATPSPVTAANELVTVQIANAELDAELAKLPWPGNAPPVTDETELHVVWSLKPGEPRIVAICSSPEVAERYRPFAEQHHGGKFYVELVLLDHAFGRRDIQSLVYSSAIRQTNGGGAR